MSPSPHHVPARRWTGHADSLLQDCDQLLSRLVTQQVQQVFGRFPAAAGRIRCGAGGRWAVTDPGLLSSAPRT